jgi:hypothetical protein
MRIAAAIRANGTKAYSPQAQPGAHRLSAEQAHWSPQPHWVLQAQLEAAGAQAQRGAQVQAWFSHLVGMG